MAEEYHEQTKAKQDDPATQFFQSNPFWVGFLGAGWGGEGKQAIFCLHKVGIWPRMPWVSAGNIHDCETDDSYMQQNRIAKENSSNRNCITYSKAVRNSLFTTVLADPYRFELKGNHTVRKSEVKPDAI